MMFESLDNISDLDKIQQVFENLGIPTNLTDEELKSVMLSIQMMPLML